MRKNIIKLMLIAGIAFTTFAVNAQGPPPPPNGGHGENTNQPKGPNGGGAPIGSGLAILLALGAGYGGKKLYDARKKTDE
jgi:hypothetical protein